MQDESKLMAFGRESSEETALSEMETADALSQRWDVAMKKAKVEDFKSSTSLKRWICIGVALIEVLYIAVVLFIVWKCGKGELDLNDVVLSVLLGTTTTNIVGLFLTVIKGVYNVK